MHRRAVLLGVLSVAACGTAELPDAEPEVLGLTSEVSRMRGTVDPEEAAQLPIT